MRKLQYTLLILLTVAGCIYLAPYVSSEPARVAKTELSKDQRQRAAIDEFFAGPIIKISIQLAPEELERLKRDARNYAEATIKEGGKVYKGVAIKLKGSAGSFQNVDAKPGLTLNFDKFKGADRFHGMKKFHLNNGAQDGTYLNESIAGEIARAAGVPASRCTHALVDINGRDLGLYVLKEAFTRDFLSYFYADPNGDLFDGGFCKEVEENMEKDLGVPEDKRGIKELIAACQEGDNAKRWERLGKILDIEEFASFCAMEAMLSHWDGYNFNRNNYRVYQDATTGRFAFFLHGMDQAFNDPNAALLRDFGSMVGGAFMRCPEGKAFYLKRLESIQQNVLKPTDWGARVVEIGSKVRDTLALKNPQLGKDYQNQINAARERVTMRMAVVAKTLGDIPKPVEFGKNGVLAVAKDWKSEGAAAQIAEAQKDGKHCLHIRADGGTAASWRKSLRLDPGRYRLEAKVATAGVVPVQSSSGEGAGLRISGGTRNGQNAASADTPWKTLGYEFDAPGGDVTLVAELRASKGEAWFQSESLQIVKVK